VWLITDEIASEINASYGNKQRLKTRMPNRKQLTLGTQEICGQLEDML
jgi:hypothetical protein